MTKEQAKEQCRKNLEEMKRIGLITSANIFEQLDFFVDSAFDWAEKERGITPSLSYCARYIKDYAESMGATAEINFKFN